LVKTIGGDFNELGDISNIKTIEEKIDLFDRLLQQQDITNKSIKTLASLLQVWSGNMKKEKGEDFPLHACWFRLFAHLVSLQDFTFVIELRDGMKESYNTLEEEEVLVDEFEKAECPVQAIKFSLLSYYTQMRKRGVEKLKALDDVEIDGMLLYSIISSGMLSRFVGSVYYPHLIDFLLVYNEKGGIGVLGEDRNVFQRVDAQDATFSLAYNIALLTVHNFLAQASFLVFVEYDVDERFRVLDAGLILLSKLFLSSLSLLISLSQIFTRRREKKRRENSRFSQRKEENSR